MDHGMGENNGGGSNGILMEEEIFDTSPTTQPQTTSSQAAQSQTEASLQHNMMAQSEMSSQYAATSQPQYGTAQPQYGSMTQPQADTPSQFGGASSQQPGGLSAFQNAPSFDAMDGMDMGVHGADSQDAFTGSDNMASSGWQNQNSDMVFQGSNAGAGPVVIHEKTPSNMILGLVGAVIGALIGAALWIGIYQLGYIAGIAGAAIIGFSIKGYIILGKSVDVKGMVLCAVLCIVTIYFAHRVSFAITYMRTMNETFGSRMSFITAYKNLDDFMKSMDAASKALGSSNSVTLAYWRDLVVGYGLSAVVGIPMALKMIARS